MKKWNNPELFMLGVGNTNEEWDTFDKDHDATSHYCHKVYPVVDCNNEQKDHSNGGNKAHIFSGNQCDEHVGGESACCCLS